MSDVDTGDAGDTATGTAPRAVAVLEHVVRSVVGDPDAVSVAVDERGPGRLELTVSVGPGDMGRVIGRRGRIANAIRTLVRAAGTADGVQVDVEFAD